MALNRWLGLLVVAVALVAQDARAQGVPSQGTPVVYLRGQALLQAAPGAAEAARTFERELADMRTELQQQAAVVDSMLQDYQRQEVLLSPQAKEQKQAEIMGLRNRLQQRQGEMDSQAQQRQQELLGPILERVGAVIEELRSENGYSIVLDASKEGLVAADTTLDITDTILARLGVTAPPPAADGGASLQP
jgi:outer membrane protein